ncbi:hypothetical protein [Chryseobacterium sp.]|uniref:hypothetical protein n=1 Tax=Chryseobacterium sp. TaxID=1871047 RepID=UPI00261C15CA|nr:hypothetical protein [Chryseobacterium sp.]
MKELKYKELIKNYNTDISYFTEKNIESYRWVFEDINHPSNFLPAYILDKERKEYDERKNKATSLGYALSLFSTKESAISKYKKILSHAPKAFLKLGTHIALGQIDENNGICDNPNLDKHFSLFEYQHVNLAEKYNVTEKIV